MATYTTNYNLEKPAQTDIYNVDVFNANADKIDAGLTDKAEKTMLAPVETTNSASRSYAKGEYFVYNNVLCCATTAIAAGGTIAIGTNCATAPVGGELTALRESLSTNVITESVLCPAISITSGTTGTYAKADSVSVAKSGYTPIQASLNNVGHPGAYQVIPVLRRQTNTLYFLYYRAGTAAVTQNAGDVEVNVTYVKS